MGRGVREMWKACRFVSNRENMYLRAPIVLFPLGYEFEKLDLSIIQCHIQ